ncbi:GNAT family N-acetyltransferase [Cohnella terricola]|uniref:GNAT family N-acetyltransferase n=1 Tax=Cohnella terricola TaxID=1289167 RepID=A0A559JQZ0_9BACL|nr:GNAT family N-acetyltransferase [Cohnella terricola]TVY02283.1 GNAT family N-acetyltransferase [Cohnella terricola]
MFKQLKVTDGHRMLTLTIRTYELEDFENLIALQAECFPPPFPSDLWWNLDQLTEHVSRFPEGALCAEIDGRIVGSMTALRVAMEDEMSHTWASVTDDGYIRNHDSEGDTIYVVDLCVAPQYRKLGIGKWLMQSMYETVVHLGCRRLLGGGRMPGYGEYADKLEPWQYIDRVSTGELYDPVITFMLRCGRLPIGIVAGYLEDEQSAHYAALMEWRNPFKVER